MARTEAGRQWWLSLTPEQQAGYISRKQADKASRRKPVQPLPEPWHRTVYYTDGSAEPNPGPGGYAAVFNGVLVAHGGERMTTSNRMEGLAILAALRHAGLQLCEIRTDSQHWVSTLTRWAPQWKKNGWRKQNGSRPANLDIVQAAVSALYQAQITWVPGHSGVDGNEQADRLAGMARLITLKRAEVCWEEFPESLPHRR